MSLGSSHNKKRNTGLLYEFLISAISRGLVENNNRLSSNSLKLLKKYFRPGTELYKEFCIINSIVKTSVNSDATAASVLREARDACKKINASELDREKSLLIRGINHTLQDDNFYDQYVKEYKTYATIQTLLNNWRMDSYNIGRVAQFEDQLIEWLTTPKENEKECVINESPGTNRLLFKIMMKKMNEKYSSTLNNDQKSLIRAYAFSTANNDMTSITKKLEEIKQKLIESIDNIKLTSERLNENVVNKLHETREKILSEKLDVIDDDTVTRFMLYAKLHSELESPE